MIQYNGSHSIDFFGDLNDRGTLNAKNTWRDWHLVPSTKPYVASAEPQFNFVSIPGSNRILDLTDYLTGSPVYSARSGDWEFIVDLEYWKDSNLAYAFFTANVHGKKLYCELQDNSGVVYLGRFAISEFASSQTYPVMKISYKISPKFKLVTSQDSSGQNIYTDETVIESLDVEQEFPVVEVPLYDL